MMHKSVMLQNSYNHIPLGKYCSTKGGLVIYLNDSLSIPVT